MDFRRIASSHSYDNTAMTLRKLSLTFCIAIALSLFSTTAFAHGAGDLPSSTNDDKVVLKVPARSALTAEQWQAFGNRVTEAMGSENRGVQMAALRLAAYHGDQLQLGHQASISAVRVYRNNPDPNVRKLAVVAIARMNHPWGIDFLTRSLDYEKSAGVKKVMRNALTERNLNN